LIIFSILLTSQINSRLDAPKLSHIVGALATACTGVSLTLVAVYSFAFKRTDLEPVVVNMRSIGLELLSVEPSGYALPFEVMSILLLAALVGTVFIARKARS
jgi:NADH-quinone oxidoreductase subunit J